MKKILRSENIALFISTGALSGFLPKAPGTWGSIVCLPIWWLFCLTTGWNLQTQIVLVIFTTLAGFISIKYSIAYFADGSEKSKDPSQIVIDEWAGMFIALIPATAFNWNYALLAFLLFRLFDIIKPFPVSRAENLPGATGIMLDDIVAGIIAALLLCLIKVI